MKTKKEMKEIILHTQEDPCCECSICSEDSCEHELYLEEETWINENKLMITCKCSLCKSQFKGGLKKQ